MTRSSMLAVGMLSLGALSACGGGGSVEDFCESYASLESMEGQDIGGLGDALDDLSDASPDEIRDDVDTLNAAFGELSSAIEDAGIDAENFDLSNPDLDPEALRDLQQDMQALETDDVRQATSNVEKYATENCDETSN